MGYAALGMIPVELPNVPEAKPQESAGHRLGLCAAQFPKEEPPRSRSAGGLPAILLTLIKAPLASSASVGTLDLSSLDFRASLDLAVVSRSPRPVRPRSSGLDYWRLRAQGAR